MSLSDIPEAPENVPPLRGVKIFDGHNDMLYQLWARGDQKGQLYLSDASDNPLCLAHHHCRTGGLAGGLFAIFVPTSISASGDPLDSTAPLSQRQAFQYTIDMIEIADYLADMHRDRFSLCKNASQAEQAARNGAIAAILHIEGAEAISPSLDELYLLKERGICSIGPLWSRPNIFGQGVPFSFPGSPDQGSGLTRHGKALLKACDETGIVLDVSHLNEAGFWDIANLSDQPLIASHSNAHALCPSPRNLTDAQLDAVAERGGLVGVCFATAYLRPDGARDPDTEIELILRQFDYLITRLGEDHVGFGSDFDGAVLPAGLANPSMLPQLLNAMQDFGFGQPLIRKLCWDNWLGQLA
jgi:membrane dipeptidase